MFYRSILAVTMALASFSSAYAANDSKEPFPLDGESTEEFREQATNLRTEMDQGSYADLSSSDKKSIDKRLDQLDALYLKRSTGATINDADALALVNASSEINSLLLGKGEDKLICEYVKRVGSNRSTKLCMTVAQREERRSSGQLAVREGRFAGTYSQEETSAPKNGSR